jgi:hypothetical protein
VHIDLITSMANLDGLFCPPGTPGPPVHPRGNFYQTDFPPLMPLPCSVLRGPALLRPHPSGGAPAGLTLAGLHRPQEVKPSKNNGSDRSSISRFAHKAFKAFRGSRGTMHLVAVRTGAESCSPRQTKSRAAIYRRASGSLDKADGPVGEFGRLHVVSQTAFHLVSRTPAAYFSPNFQFSDGEHPRWRTSDTSTVYHQVRA